MTMTLAKHGHRRPLPALRPAADRGGGLRRRAPRHRPYPRQLAFAAGDRNHRPRRRRFTPTDLHHLFRRWCGLTPKAFLQALTLSHARDLLRSSASVLDTAYEVGLSGPGPAARSLRHARGDVAGRMEGGRRRAHHLLRLPSLPVRHGAGDDHAARARRSCARRRRQGARGVARHALALAEARNMSRISRRLRRPRGAFSIRRCGAPSSRCAWC